MLKPFKDALFARDKTIFFVVDDFPARFILHLSDRLPAAVF
jgi:hypothetical protein